LTFDWLLAVEPILGGRSRAIHAFRCGETANNAVIDFGRNATRLRFPADGHEDKSCNSQSAAIRPEQGRRDKRVDSALRLFSVRLPSVRLLRLRNSFLYFASVQEQPVARLAGIALSLTQAIATAG
jgi:hypothetical protein